MINKFLFLILNLLFLSITALASTQLNTKEKIIHVLNRFSYGPQLDEVKSLEKKGPQAAELWFVDQLNVDIKKVEQNIQTKLKSFSSLNYTNEQMLKAFPKKNKINMSESEIEGAPKDILIELTMQKLLRAIESKNQLHEVMIDFWFNHFNVNFDKSTVKQSITSYERDVIRPHVFGKFEDLLMATAKSPAMLIYLDNNASRQGKINENYARELLELHTLGVDGGYTQKDIQEAARVLTGWGVEKPRLISKYKFFSRQHDQDSKVVLGLKFKGHDGQNEGEQLIKYLARHPSTADFIAKKLALKFISDKPSDETIRHISTIFKKTNGDLKLVYQGLLTAPEFFDRKSYNSKIKTPLEYFASAARATKAEYLPTADKFKSIRTFFEQSGQPLYRCQPPTGFKAISEHWVNPGALVNRMNLALALTSGKVTQLKIDLTSLTNELKDKKLSSQIPILEHFNETLFFSTIKPETLKKIDLVIQDSKNYVTSETDEIPFHYYSIDKLLGLLLSTPEFQRR